jgi:hypothetical protein
MDAAQHKKGVSRPSKVQRPSKSTTGQADDKHTSAGGALEQVDGSSPPSSQRLQPSLHAFFDSTSRENACAEADAAAAAADAARSAAAVAAAAAAQEQHILPLETRGQLMQSAEEDFDIGADSLFD